MMRIRPHVMNRYDENINMFIYILQWEILRIRVTETFFTEEAKF